MKAESFDELDDVGDLTATDFFERARWARTGEPFDPPAYARHQLRELEAHLDRLEGAERNQIETALDHVRAALRSLEAA